jgi:hypothetical protein
MLLWKSKNDGTASISESFEGMGVVWIPWALIFHSQRALSRKGSNRRGIEEQVQEDLGKRLIIKGNKMVLFLVYYFICFFIFLIDQITENLSFSGSN